MWGNNQGGWGGQQGGWGGQQGGWGGQQGGWGGQQGGWGGQQGGWGGQQGGWGNGPQPGFGGPGFGGPGFGGPGFGGPGFGGPGFGGPQGGFQIPDSFDYKQKLFTSGKDMRLLCGGNEFGFIDHKSFSYGKNFDLLDNNKNIIAQAKQQHFTFGRDFRVFDGFGSIIGTLDNQAFKSAFSVYTKYSIKDPSGQIIAKLQQFEFINSSVKVRDMYGNIVAEFQQKFNIARDNWHANFFGNSIDRRLLVFFPAIFSQRDDRID